jgi:mono/diheme cytochrome c family protein
MIFRKLHVLLILAIAACLTPIFLLQRDTSQPHYELIPERQMARTAAFGAFTLNPNFADGITFQNPPKGTIARGAQPFPYGPGENEMERAGKELTNLLSFNAQTKEQGAILYANNCKCCHGLKGLGDGLVPLRGFPQPKSFIDPNVIGMKDGEYFHILTFGRGNMPAHAIQLMPTERWAVILHVRVLQNRYTELPHVSLEETKKTFLANCAKCHNLNGTGSVMRETKTLPYIPDFSSLAWQLAKTNLEITNRIEYGDEPLMPAFRYRMTRDQILGLSIYIRSFAIRDGGPGPSPLPSTEGLEPVQIFRAYCLACHNADGQGAIMRPGMPDIPDFTLTKENTADLTLPKAKWIAKTDADLSKAILTGGKSMPPMKDKLAPAVADKMVHFVRGFRDGKYKVPLESQGEVVKAKPPDFDPDKFKVLPIDKDKFKPEPTSPEVKERLRLAGVVFREYCVACHNVDGSGVPAMRLTLPMLPDFSKTAFRDQHSDTQLLISILDGKGTGMPANRGRISEPQARDLVAVVRTFAPPGDGATVGGAPNQFQRDFELLQKQWEALEREIRALKKTPNTP